MLVDYVRRQYVPNNLVIAVAGNVEHQEVVDQVAAALGDLPPGTPDPWQPALVVEGAPRVKVARRRTEQAHLSVSVPGLSHMDPDRETLDMVNIVLGDGMTSRLFLNIRERMGLAYDVHSYASHLLDTGTVTVYAGVDPKRVDAALGAVLDELGQMQDGLTSEELHKAKELTKGRLLLRMEDTRAVSSWMGGQELLTGQVLTPDEVVEKIDAVTVEGTRRVAGRLFRVERLSLALVGPYASEKRFQKLLRG
jgi:predicted Zn-dependent peptidase